MERDDVDQVFRAAEGGPPTPGTEKVQASWKRCANTYGVNPAAADAPRILTRQELTDFRQPLDELIFSAHEEIDRLHRLVREAGYTVLLCDATGVAVEHRRDDSKAGLFEYWGTCLGGVWAEQTEAPTASAPASRKSDRLPFTAASTFDHDTRI